GCHGNPGPGGWAYVITREEAGKQVIVKEAYSGEKLTTNNRMELTAVIRALETLSAGLPTRTATFYTDSEYVKNGITLWIHDWKKRGWKTAAKKPVKNQDLWQQLDDLAAPLELTWRWVRGHNGTPLNERCDTLTQKAILEEENS
ncbi:MAG: ribonuclease HI, partial [Spirochaetaceae bacterium]|nr:ribonuclease HI [Spirochaetaceae bacterium]